MRTIPAEQTTLEDCVRDARDERVIITRNGVPVALVIGVEGLDEEQVARGSSDDFWRLIAGRRAQKTVGRSAIEGVAGEEEPVPSPE